MKGNNFGFFSDLLSDKRVSGENFKVTKKGKELFLKQVGVYLSFIR